MKSYSTLSKLSVVTAALMLFSACSKNEDVTPNNIMAYRNDNSQSQSLYVTTISTDMVLEDRVSGVDYTIANNIQVNANLTIKPGVTVAFKDGAGIQVNEQGSLTAIGANGNVILFTSATDKRSGWKGITILNSNARNVISYCRVEQGGAANSFGTGNIIVGSKDKTGEVEISYSEITASGNNGILIAEGSKVHGFTGNKIHTNSSFPVSMHITDAANMTDGNQMVNNGKEFIQVTGDARFTITKEISLKKLNESFLVSGMIVAGNKFCVAAGSRVYMDNGAEIIIDGYTGQGTFCAIGSASSPISIAAIYNGTGMWKNIRFRASESNQNRIEYCTISGGGASDGSHAQGMISVVDNATIVIRNSTIINSAATGIYLEANAAYNNDILSGNTFSNNVLGNVHFE